MTSMLSSKLRRAEGDQTIFETTWRAPNRSILELKTPIIPFPALPTPRPGCPVVITASYLVHIASLSRSPQSSHFAHSTVSTHHSALLSRILASLIKESPPLHISLRGTDPAASRLNQLDAQFGETDFGVSFIQGGKTPERSVVLDAEGRVVCQGSSDLLVRQASEGFVQKFADYLRVETAEACHVESPARRLRGKSAALRAAVRGQNRPEFWSSGVSGLFGERIVRGCAGKWNRGNLPVDGAEPVECGAVSIEFDEFEAKRIA